MGREGATRKTSTLSYPGGHTMAEGDTHPITFSTLAAQGGQNHLAQRFGSESQLCHSLAV